MFWSVRRVPPHTPLRSYQPTAVATQHRRSTKGSQDNTDRVWWLPDAARFAAAGAGIKLVFWWGLVLGVLERTVPCVSLDDFFSPHPRAQFVSRELEHGWCMLQIYPLASIVNKKKTGEKNSAITYSTGEKLLKISQSYLQYDWKAIRLVADPRNRGIPFPNRVQSNPICIRGRKQKTFRKKQNNILMNTNHSGSNFSPSQYSIYFPKWPPTFH